MRACLGSQVLARKIEEVLARFQMLLEGPPFSFCANVNLKLSHALFFNNLILFLTDFFPLLVYVLFLFPAQAIDLKFSRCSRIKKCRIRERGKQSGKDNICIRIHKYFLDKFVIKRTKNSAAKSTHKKLDEKII